MARKKSTQRKVKMDGNTKGNGSNGGSGRNTPVQDEIECDGENDANNNEDSYPEGQQQASLSGSDKHFSYGNAPVVRIKQEPEPSYEYDTTVATASMCSHNALQQYSGHTALAGVPNIKEESDSTKGTVFPTTSMDLGSHLQQSLGGTGLTWSHLMEPKNFPKPYEVGGSVVSKKDNGKREMSVSSKPQASESASSIKHGGSLYSPAARDQLLSTSKDGNASHNLVTTAGGHTSTVATTGGSLDLSKKGLPPEIRRMLASKYGLQKRSDHEGTSMVPNFAKSRSRFTVAPKKTTGAVSDAETSLTLKTSDTRSTVSPSPSGNQPDTEAMSPVEVSNSTHALTNTSVITSTGSGSITLTVPQTTDHQSSTKDDDHGPADKLENQPGMLDLASHYGNLIKEAAPPPVRARSKSRSPHVEESTSSSPVTEPMIDLGSVSRLNELRPPALRRVGGEPMIDLSAMETPTSPLSPNFRPVSFGVFPNPPYRSTSSTTQSYRPRTATRGPPRSPLLSPRLPFSSYHPKSPDPRPRPIISLPTFSKGTEFPSMVTSRPSDIGAIPNQVAQRIMPKRRHSLDSQSLPREAKRSCLVERKKDEIVKAESNSKSVKLNIGDLLKLEQEEQKYIKDLSFVQNKLTDMRFKLQMMQQELEGLQVSEDQIRRHIDSVRTKRVRMLKEAQDREGNKGDVDRGTERYQAMIERERADHGDHRMLYGRASPASYQPTSYRENQSSDIDLRSSGVTRRKAGDHVVTEMELGEGAKEVTADRMVNRNRSEIGGYHYGKYGPRTILHHTSSGGEPEAAVTTSAGYAEKSRRLDDDSGSPSDNTIFTEALDRHSVVSDTTTGGGGAMLVLRQSATVHRPARKGSQSSVEDTVRVWGPEHGGPKQFLGCLEISSTTSDEETQISAENERKQTATNTSSDQQTISSTVSNLDDNVDEIEDLNEMEFIGHTDAVCAIIPFRNKLFSASADRSVRAFDLKTGKCLNTLQGHQKGINCLQIASDIGSRDRLFTGSNDQTVRAYNMASGTCTHKFSFRGRVMCLHIAFGKLFVGLSSGFVAVIDLKTNKCTDQFNCHEPSRISCLASTSTGHHSLLCTGSFDSNITVRDQETGRLRRLIKDHKLTVLCMQVVDNVLFSGSADTIVQSHNLTTGDLLQSYVGHSMSVSGLQAMGGPQGGVLVTSSLDRIVRCFDIKSGDLLQLYGGNNDMIFSLAVCKDMIYTGCRDGKLSSLKLDLRKYHCCKWDDCSLKFGLLRHLKQHIQDHANQTYAFNTCLWENCTHKFQKGKLIDIMQGAIEHIVSHVPDTDS